MQSWSVELYMYVYKPKYRQSVALHAHFISLPDTMPDLLMLMKDVLFEVKKNTATVLRRAEERANPVSSLHTPQPGPVGPMEGKN